MDVEIVGLQDLVNVIYKQGYNKAIDDFANVLIERSIKVSTIKEHAYFKAVGTNEIRKIAEQLKAGASNENNS